MSLEIKKFEYHQKLREILVTEQNETSLKGIDLSYANDTEKKQIRKLAAELSFSSDLNEEELKAEVEKLRPAMKYFRHFKKADIVIVDEKPSKGR
jgi:hypothetical protein